MRKKLDSPDRDALYLDDILASTRLVGTYLRGVRLPDFIADTARGNEKVDSVSRRLIVIGEAVKSLSEQRTRRLREEHPEIQWNDIAMLKDKLTHHWTIDRLQLWEIAKVHVPILERVIRPLTRSTRRRAVKAPSRA